ncbi:creatininase family protein [Paenibacillus cymbidii]|uniref:creatininase family protein n=1 Tax=Paenibacillus cymbidii TaxID=1639034 RepID=UPI001081C089|nr:creatininase family protein [Paenibacillus cymbidii]
MEQLAHLTRDEVAAVAGQAVVVLPIGAIEQHGPHLPLGVDAMAIEAIAERSCKQLQGELAVYCAPVLVYGSSHHHFPFPAMSLSSETLLLVLKDLLRSLARTGFRAVFVLNGHGGNDEMIRAAARDMTSECGISIAAASYWSIAWQALTEANKAQQVGRVPGHAGGFETSLMLAIRPDLVREERFPPRREDETPREEMARRLFVQHPGRQVGRDGYSDDASRADRRLGEACLQTIARETAAAIRSFAAQARFAQE